MYNPCLKHDFGDFIRKSGLIPWSSAPRRLIPGGRRPALDHFTVNVPFSGYSPEFYFLFVLKNLSVPIIFAQSALLIFH
jgi:hypothetical protein